MSVSLLNACIIGTSFALTILCKSLSEPSQWHFYISFGNPTEPLLVSVLESFVYRCQNPHRALFIYFRNSHWTPVGFGLRILCVPLSEPSQYPFHIGFGIVIGPLIVSVSESVLEPLLHHFYEGFRSLVIWVSVSVSLSEYYVLPTTIRIRATPVGAKDGQTGQ